MPLSQIIQGVFSSDSMLKIINILVVFSCLTACAHPLYASRATLRKFCFTKDGLPPSLLLAAHTSAQQSAIKRNIMMREGKIVYTDTESEALFYTSAMRKDDCILVNLDELITLEAAKASSEREQYIQAQTNFLPAILYPQQRGKQYGLIETRQLQHLAVSTLEGESNTEEILNYANGKRNGLVLIYLTCPSDRNSLCDLSIKKNGSWLLDAKTGEKIRMKVLARSQRDSNTTT
ncbi:MAG: hypothetical protein D3923_15500, partial [Candidatus Electrothrix sp. AR3]|nr:hypothetical protein [Candidatus Electrothrix sp. AR3]